MKLILSTAAAALIAGTAFAGQSDLALGTTSDAPLTIQDVTPVLRIGNESEKERKVRDKTYISAANDSR